MTETIVAVITIGFSIDYVLHFSHVYLEAGHEKRISSRVFRTKYAFDQMGSTICGGALTTGGSASVMMFCYLTFFNKIGVMIAFTILLSFLFTFLFFANCMLILGPEGASADFCQAKPVAGGAGATSSKKAVDVDVDRDGKGKDEDEKSDSVAPSPVKVQDV